MATLRLHNVRVRFDAPLDEITRAAFAKLRGVPVDMSGLRVVRRSIDTRSRPRIFWSVAVEFEGAAELISHLPANEASVVEEAPEPPIVPGAQTLTGRPVVIGSGPAGLFAALVLCEFGHRPLVLERGKDIPARNRDVEALVASGAVNPESNFLRGLGGAGAYSDGKLTTRIGDWRVRRVLETFVSCGAPESILIDARPHIGSDLLPGIVTNLRSEIESRGGEFRFGSPVASLVIEPSGRVCGVVTQSGESVQANIVICAPGSWSDELIKSLLSQGVAMEAKPFQVGVRIEHPQALVDHGVYGRERGELPAAEYVMSCPPRGYSRGLATFCMCPGGVIVPAVCGEGRLSTNGMSRSGRDGAFANSALVVTVNPEELEGSDPLRGLRYQESLERAAYAVTGSCRAPGQTFADFVAGRKSESLPGSSYPLGVEPANLTDLLPRVLSAAVRNAVPSFERKIPGFAKRGLLVGIEARVSSPVRIVRDRETFESVSTPGLYPVGEGAGYAGGIVSGAVDGIRAAEAVVKRFSPS